MPKKNVKPKHQLRMNQLRVDQSYFNPGAIESKSDTEEPMDTIVELMDTIVEPMVSIVEPMDNNIQDDTLIVSERNKILEELYSSGFNIWNDIVNMMSSWKTFVPPNDYNQPLDEHYPDGIEKGEYCQRLDEILNFCGVNIVTRKRIYTLLASQPMSNMPFQYDKDTDVLKDNIQDYIPKKKSYILFDSCSEGCKVYAG